jgi:hypothetical protein
MTWAHLVTADGESEGIRGTVRVSNGTAEAHDERLADGRLTTTLASLPARVSLTLEANP